MSDDPEPGMEARYPDICGRCHTDIVPGDRFVFVRGRRIHVRCAAGQDE